MTGHLTAAVVALLFLCFGSDAAGQTPPPSPPAKPPAGQQQKPVPPDPHAGHMTTEPQKPAPVPPVTEEDRRAAFPNVDGHSVHDTAIHYFVLFDQLEWQRGSGSFGGGWDTKGWIGGDLNRLWFRTEADIDEGRVAATQHHALFGRAVSRWWDVVAGIRQDFRPGPAQTWAAVGIQGLAPYWFEVEATAYIGAGGRTHFRVETEYELLLTNRLVLQPLLEMEIYGKDDPPHGFGAGLATIETGLRLRYEFRRELAPYIGITWDRKFFGTADLARAAGERVSGTAVAIGLRTWF